MNHKPVSILSLCVYPDDFKSGPGFWIDARGIDSAQVATMLDQKISELTHDGYLFESAVYYDDDQVKMTTKLKRLEKLELNTSS